MIYKEKRAPKWTKGRKSCLQSVLQGGGAAHRDNRGGYAAHRETSDEEAKSIGGGKRKKRQKNYSKQKIICSHGRCEKLAQSTTASIT